MEKDIALVNKETGLIMNYGVKDKIINAMKKYTSFTIDGIDDKKGLEIVHSARMKVKNLRCAVQNKEVDYNKQINEQKRKLSKQVKDEAANIYKKLKPIEDDLFAKESAIIDEKERIKKEAEEKEAKRVFDIKQRIAKISNHSTIEYNETSEALQQRIKMVENMIIDDTYEEFQFEAKTTKDNVLTRLKEVHEQTLKREKEDAEREAEKERLAKQKEEQDKIKFDLDHQAALIDNEKFDMEKAKEAEEEKLKAEREALEKEKAELARQKKNNRLSRIVNIGLVLTGDDTRSFGNLKYSEKALLSLDDREFDLRIKSITSDIEAEKTRLKKEQEEKEQREKEEAEQREVEAKKRAEELKPIKDKLTEYAFAIDNILNSAAPESIEDENIETILSSFIGSVESAIETFRDQIEKL